MMISFVWGVIFLLYALGYFFSPDNKKVSVMLCWMSCCFGLGVWHYSEFNLMELSLYQWYIDLSYLLYAVIDFFIASVLFLFGFKSLGRVVYLSSLLHSTALAAYSLGYLPYFTLYGYAMIGINLLLLGMLFRDSHGAGMVLECYRRVVDILPNSHHRRKMDRYSNDLYTNQLLSRHTRDFV